MSEQAQPNKIIQTGNGEEWAFFCPGCRYYHSFRYRQVDLARSGPIWQWNGSVENPTFAPSLLVGPGTQSQCHLFVTDGKIIYLADCWHELRGQIVDMQDIDF